MPTLLRELQKFYATSARTHLPWRKTRDPYKILVSELMLQQTQVDRVVPFYNRFIKTFPTPQTLAKAPFSKVLLLWQGLGYNRRAKYLYETAKVLARTESAKKGDIHTAPAPFLADSAELSTEFLERLPGVGPYTAGAISVFAFNKPEVFVETNIRTVFFHHFYRDRDSVSDAELLPMVALALQKSRTQPRDFYAALMDYGSHLKKQGVKLNARSKHYVKQSTFEGSARQLRGALLRELLIKPATLAQLTKNLSPRTRGEVVYELRRLQGEKMVAARGARFWVA